MDALLNIKTVIMAGGKGTRLASIAVDIPKPMVRVFDKPILEYQLDCLKQNNLTDIILVTGHLGDAVRDYFGDGKKFGCNISYYHETTPLGTAGALFKIKNELSEDFALLNGDILFDMDFARIFDFHFHKKALATLAVHPNSHPFDSALILTGADDRITGWLNKEEPRLYYRNQVNAGIHIINRGLLDKIVPQKEKIDLDRDVLKPAISTDRLFAYHTPEYIKDMGTPERYAQVSKDIESALPRQKNLKTKQKAVFLDRDGTINKTKGFLNKPEDFELLPGVSKAIKAINASGYLAIVITNQPVIARGECSPEELEIIHQKMESDLGKDGAYIDDLFYCPHHPDKGFAGERVEYKIDCDCRKPKPGLILSAAKKYNIDLAASCMVGDDMRDVRAGINAGCRAVFLNDTPMADTITENGITINQFKSLPEFVNDFLRNNENNR